MSSKASTGIQGFDEITQGGLPQGRVTIVEGGPGTGKTLFSWAFLSNGALKYGEPGLAIAFDLTREEIVDDLAGIDIELSSLLDRQLFLYTIGTLDYADQVSGDFNLRGLELIVASYVEKHGVRRLVLDSIQSLLRVAKNQHLLRKEIARFFARIKALGITALIISEEGVGDFDLDFLSDCNIRLDMRMVDEKATRRLCVTKLRGSYHETNEFPFLIGEAGLQVMPLTSIRLAYQTPEERLSTGIVGLDGMLEGKGYYRGSSILVSGTAGTGKTSLVSWLAHASCGFGGKVLYVSFEESESQLVRNMKSIGMDLAGQKEKGCFGIHTGSSAEATLEHHMGRFMALCEREQPDLVVLDPITNFVNIGNPYQVKNVLMRMINFFKDRQITSVFTSLATAGNLEKDAGTEISSLMDLWIWLDTKKVGSDRQKTLQVIKARGIDCDTSDHKLVLSGGGVAVERLKP